LDADSLSGYERVLNYFVVQQNWIIPLLITAILIPIGNWTWNRLKRRNIRAYAIDKDVQGNTPTKNSKRLLALELVFENIGNAPIRLEKLGAQTKHGKDFYFKIKSRSQIASSFYSPHSDDLPFLLQKDTTWRVRIADVAMGRIPLKGYFIEDDTG